MSNPCMWDVRDKLVYPVIGIYTRGMMVRFGSLGVGEVISDLRGQPYSKGYRTHGWNMDVFTPLTVDGNKIFPDKQKLQGDYTEALTKY